MNPLIRHYFYIIVAVIVAQAALYGCVTTALPTSFDQQLYAANQQIVTINNLITNAVIREQITPDKAEAIAAKVDQAKSDLNAIKAVKYTISGQEGIQRTQAILNLLTEIERGLQ